MPSGFDGRYDYTHPWTSPPKWTYQGPWASNEERLVQQALATAMMSGAEIRSQVGPVAPPNRFGFSQYALSIEDILGLGRRVQRAPNYSGSPAGYEGTSRNALG